MSQVKTLLMELLQSTKADGTGLIGLKPEMAEMDFLEESLLNFFSDLPVSTYVSYSSKLCKSITHNNVIRTNDFTVFFKICNGQFLWYAFSRRENQNVARYYSMLTLIANKYGY